MSDGTATLVIILASLVLIAVILRPRRSEADKQARRAREMWAALGRALNERPAPGTDGDSPVWPFADALRGVPREDHAATIRPLVADLTPERAGYLLTECRKVPRWYGIDAIEAELFARRESRPD